MKTLIPLFLSILLILSGCDNRIGNTARNQGNILVAVSLYYAEHNGQWPTSLEILIPKYIDSIPKEEITKTNRVVTTFDGKGGWVYNSSTGEVTINIDLKSSP